MTFARREPPEPASIRRDFKSILEELGFLGDQAAPTPYPGVQGRPRDDARADVATSPAETKSLTFDGVRQPSLQVGYDPVTFRELTVEDAFPVVGIAGQRYGSAADLAADLAVVDAGAEWRRAREVEDEWPRRSRARWA